MSALRSSGRPPVVCWFCRVPLHLAQGHWVDDADGDVCSGDIHLTNENGSHMPEVLR